MKKIRQYPKTLQVLRYIDGKADEELKKEIEYWLIFHYKEFWPLMEGLQYLKKDLGSNEAVLAHIREAKAGITKKYDMLR